MKRQTQNAGKLMKTFPIRGRPSVCLQEMTSIADSIGASEEILQYKPLQA